MTPYYEHAGITIYHGDCMDILPHIDGEVDCVVSDPPYGMNWDGNVSNGKNGHDITGSKTSLAGVKIVGDDKPFDPRPWLMFDQAILFGCNHFMQRLPVGTTLVWIKRLDGAFGSFLSDAELAWMKGGHGVYCFRDLSNMSNTRDRKHPSQKPVPLMSWCIKKTKGTILDPYMGSGTTLVAAKEMSRRAIGIEIEEKYCEIAAKRLSQEVLPL